MDMDHGHGGRTIDGAGCTGPNDGPPRGGAAGPFSRLRKQAEDPALAFGRFKRARCRRIIRRRVRAAIAKGDNAVSICQDDFYLKSTFDCICALSDELERDGFRTRVRRRSPYGGPLTTPFMDIAWD